MKIALIQLEVKEKNKTANVEQGLKLLEKAVKGQDVVLLPEIWTTGYSLSRLEEEAEEINGPLVKRMQELAKMYACNIVGGSIPLRYDGKIHNTSVIINKNGEILHLYSKTHLFGLFKEERFFAAGNDFSLYELDGELCGSAICYDLRFPELFRRLAMDGAKIIFVPAEWPEPRGEVWRLLAQARAVENQTYICAVNCVGTFKGERFYGHSMLIAPTGEIIVEGGNNEEILYGEVEFDLIDKLRKRINALEDVRPELFPK